MPIKIYTTTTTTTTTNWTYIAPYCHDFLLLSVQIELLCPQPGYVEMDEWLIWQQVQDVIKEAISSNAISLLTVFLFVCRHVFDVCEGFVVVMARLFVYLFIYLLFARNHQCDNHM